MWGSKTNTHTHTPFSPLVGSQEKSLEKCRQNKSYQVLGFFSAIFFTCLHETGRNGTIRHPPFPDPYRPLDGPPATSSQGSPSPWLIDGPPKVTGFPRGRCYFDEEHWLVDANSCDFCALI